MLQSCKTQGGCRYLRKKKEHLPKQVVFALPDHVAETPPDTAKSFPCERAMWQSDVMPDFYVALLTSAEGKNGAKAVRCYFKPATDDKRTPDQKARHAKLVPILEAELAHESNQTPFMLSAELQQQEGSGSVRFSTSLLVDSQSANLAIACVKHVADQSRSLA